MKFSDDFKKVLSDRSSCEGRDRDNYDLRLSSAYQTKPLHETGGGTEFGNQGGSLDYGMDGLTTLMKILTKGIFFLVSALLLTVHLLPRHTVAPRKVTSTPLVEAVESKTAKQSGSLKSPIPFPSPEVMVQDKLSQTSFGSGDIAAKGWAESADKKRSLSSFGLTRKKMSEQEKKGYYLNGSDHYVMAQIGTDYKAHLVNGLLKGFKPFAVDNPWLVSYAVAQRLDYQKDKEVYGWEDIWATAQEAYVRRKGDCEDHSILLADWLISLGYDARVVVGRTHVWVVMYEGGKAWFLEATLKKPPRLPPLADYSVEVPEFMFNGESSWVPVKEKAVNYSPEAWLETGRFHRFESELEAGLFEVKEERELRNNDKVLELLRTMLVSYPDEFQVLIPYVEILKSQRLHEELVVALRRLVALTPDSAQNRLDLGLALRKLGAKREALAALKEAEALDPNLQGLKEALSSLKNTSAPGSIRSEQPGTKRKAVMRRSVSDEEWVEEIMW